MTTKELKQKYISFFEKRGHKYIPSASLIPENDPTVLFTTAGMHPLVPYLLGEEHPLGKRLVDVQKCLRTDDIDLVGDSTHLTFLEMLGNWSLGDYWKKESITWSFEFLTQELEIPIDKLAFTCFAGDEDAPKDEESASIWRSLGVQEGRIFFLGKKDNWWGPVGSTGPCGPDTEIFYWTGDGDPVDLNSAENSGDWVEIWNNVFMEYEKTSDGKYVPLNQKNVDTGMGVERTVTVLNGKESVYETGIFKKLTEKISEYASSLNEKSVRIISDHVRAATFILGDQRCIAPSNVDQGYVLRKLIRRAVRQGKKMGIEKPFLLELSRLVTEEYKGEYPEFSQNQNFIEKYLRLEEERFRKILTEGEKESHKEIDSKNLIEKYADTVESQGGLVVSRASVSAFNLYQSKGYPPEMFLEDLRERANLDQVAVDRITSDLDKLVEEHQKTSRAGAEQKFKGGLSDTSDQVVKYHTATHLLNKALREVLGDHVRQIGSNITSERLRFDFPHMGKLTEDQIKDVEKIVNNLIDQKIPVNFAILSREEAEKLGAVHLKGEEYPDQVKVYFIGDSIESSVSREFCGGPHVENTGDIGHIEIYRQDKIGDGKMRIYARNES